LVLIAALLIAAIGTLLGAAGIALSLLSGGPDVITMVTFSVSVLVLSLGFGAAAAWHAWRATQGYPSAAFRPRMPWLLLPLFLLAMVLGQAVLTYSILPTLVFPLFHIAASALPPLLILAVVGHALRGISTWRQVVLQASAGVLLAAPLAMLIETVAILLIAIAAVTGTALQPGGQELLIKAMSYLEDPAWLQDPGTLASTLMTPVVLAAVVAIVAGLIPLIEEAIKTIGVGLMAKRKLSLPEAVLWGLAAGAGFSIAEGLLNSAGALGTWLPTVLLRVGTTLLHCLTGALMGLAWYQLVTQRRWARGLSWYLASVAIHGLWNGLAAVMTLLSITAIGSGTDSDGLLAATLGTVAIFLLLVLLALGMIGGLAGMTAYARRQIPATEMLSSVQEMTTAPEATFPANPESEA
jgi:hypothetical protein